MILPGGRNSILQILRGIALCSTRGHGIPEYLPAILLNPVRRIQCSAAFGPADYRK
jgi:hypothetical protein